LVRIQVGLLLIPLDTPYRRKHIALQQIQHDDSRYHPAWLTRPQTAE